MLGEVIHGYRIERAMAADKGGFGDVFFARHVNSGAEAVVKMLKPEMSAMHDIVARFFNEARAAATVHHPGIVQIHNVGYHRDRAYLLMERLHGEDLETRLATGALPLDRALVFLRQAAGAIGAAHDRGIVHRDLKPANLFIVSDPDVVGGERIKVLDFGIAKLTAETGAGVTQGVFGTPAYMSPEQCASTAAVDHRADLYSLGCIFYELVCGRPPFGYGGIELIAAHLRDQPTPPRVIAPWLPPPVEQVILGLLAKQPGLRPPTCAALIAQLDAVTGAAAMSVPPMQRPPGYATSPGAAAAAQTTLGAAAGERAPSGKRRIWLGGGALMIVGGVVAAVVVLGRGQAPIPPHDPIPYVEVDAAPVMPDANIDAPTTPDAASTPDVQPTPDAPRPKAHVSRPKPDIPRTSPPTTNGAPATSPAFISVADRAARFNDQAKQLMYESKFPEASRKFQAAIALVAEPMYFFNLCVSETNEGRINEALEQCKSVLMMPEASSELKTKANKMIAKIREVAKEQKVELSQ